MPRDYKNNKRPAPPSSAGGFIAGLMIGLSIALGVYVYDHHSLEVAAPKPAPLERAATAAPTAAARPTASQPADPQFDFYEMLPKFEVVIPEQDESAPVQARSVPMQKPGVYMLQAGSFRSSADAERVRALIALQGVESKIQRVSIDRDTWHRVRIGPITNLKKLEEVRSKLRQAQVEALIIRVGG